MSSATSRPSEDRGSMHILCTNNTHNMTSHPSAAETRNKSRREEDRDTQQSTRILMPLRKYDTRNKAKVRKIDATINLDASAEKKE